ncbi:G-protein coupled receptor Mth-like [Pectinophora gossypiella]|uniref:G-protein coupled receptor Mth-like n=1 Tax=Pectinophora gossypiella TaxID=13191 RepID=UPI00214ED0B3|nr:G-protein coupled receptor Mth-like [Pectinophora gossypiella]XP_049877732.1 G-protein coupled receptor Mth-like [Pectinophora gossypiella]XP_049877733.1 G-protein coupled receptor Mth-like [Pectinophora gossypiella]XP_049877734.1 G-protein coupled receptor Mth-like [Pectinophora gossypiella]
MKYVVVFLAVVGTVSALEGGRCCPEGQAIIRRRTTPHYCWEPKSNTTSFIPLTCNQSATIAPTDEMDFYVNSANQLVLQLPNLDVEYEPGTFCVGNTTSFRDRNLTKAYRVVIICFVEEVKSIDEDVYGVCMTVSAILLFVTAIIYIALPELRDLQGKSIINFCLSLGIGLAILAAMKLVPYSDMNLCAARGFFAYFFVIASFFWTNAISIQILLSIRRPTVSNYGWREFIYYAIYAWGCPAVLTIVMAIINFTPGDHQKPGIGLNHCWFFNRKQQWQYMYSVMTILIAINIGIFIYISIQLWRNSFSSNHMKALRYKFVMTIRLFVVMGVAWIFEMIGSVSSSHITWEILDVINSLQGVFIFLVLVVFRRKVIKSMHRHGWLDCVSGPVERCLAVGEDEEDVVQHTIGVSMDDPKNNKH